MKAYTKRTTLYWLTWTVYYLTFAIAFEKSGLVKNTWVFLAVFFLGVLWTYIDRAFDQWRLDGKIDDESR